MPNYSFTLRASTKRINPMVDVKVITMSIKLRADGWNEAYGFVSHLVDDNPMIDQWEYVRGGEDVN